MLTLGIIADTHIIPGWKRHLPPIVFEKFAGVDFILHAGDLNTLQVVTELEALAPVFAVYGNNDDFEAVHTLPATRQLQIEDCQIGLTHGDVGIGKNTPMRALSHFPEADCIVFGHSHRSLIEWRELPARQVLLFNPGSPTDRRWGPHLSIGLLRVDGKRLEPELLTWE